MTLSYALIADGGIVLAVDSQVTYTHKILSPTESRIVSTYQGKTGKLLWLPNGSACSIAGNRGLADTLLAKVPSAETDTTEPFDEMVQRYSAVFKQEYENTYNTEQRPDAAFLFCGYVKQNGKHIPRIIKLAGDTWFVPNPAATGGGFGFAGDKEHGGLLYLHHRFYKDSMPLERAKLLAYCIVAEVAEMSNTVGGPIEMTVVTESGAQPFTDLEGYERKRQALLEKVRSFLN